MQNRRDRSAKFGLYARNREDWVKERLFIVLDDLASQQKKENRQVFSSHYLQISEIRQYRCRGMGIFWSKLFGI